MNNYYLWNGTTGDAAEFVIFVYIKIFGIILEYIRNIWFIRIYRNI